MNYWKWENTQPFYSTFDSHNPKKFEMFFRLSKVFSCASVSCFLSMRPVSLINFDCRCLSIQMFHIKYSFRDSMSCKGKYPQTTHKIPLARPTKRKTHLTKTAYDMGRYLKTSTDRNNRMSRVRNKQNRMPVTHIKLSLFNLLIKKKREREKKVIWAFLLPLKRRR